MLTNVVEAHNRNPGERFGIVVDALPEDDKVTVHAINPKNPISNDVPLFPTQHGERLGNSEVDDCDVSRIMWDSCAFDILPYENRRWYRMESPFSSPSQMPAPHTPDPKRQSPSKFQNQGHRSPWSSPLSNPPAMIRTPQYPQHRKRYRMES